VRLTGLEALKDTIYHQANTLDQEMAEMSVSKNASSVDQLLGWMDNRIYELETSVAKNAASVDQLLGMEKEGVHAPARARLRCGFCGAHPTRTVCSRCQPRHKQHYCSRECQIGDWPYHKVLCRKRSTAAKNAAKNAADIKAEKRAASSSASSSTPATSGTSSSASSSTPTTRASTKEQTHGASSSASASKPHHSQGFIPGVPQMERKLPPLPDDDLPQMEGKLPPAFPSSPEDRRKLLVELLRQYRDLLATQALFTTQSCPLNDETFKNVCARANAAERDMAAHGEYLFNALGLVWLRASVDRLIVFCSLYSSASSASSSSMSSSTPD
jgi:hypothetical protein